MIKYIVEGRQRLKELFEEIVATNDKGAELPLNEAFEASVKMLLEEASNGRKIILIGNGASAAIASHIATDFWKNAGIKAIAFNDASGLTCISNDFGYEHVFKKPIEMFSDPGDILIAMSSSGKSENIICAAKAAKANNLKIITLSGFDKDNSLRGVGDINFYIPSDSYGHIEVLHHSICHCLVDTIIKAKNG